MIVGSRVQRDDRRVREIGREQILGAELNAVAHAGGARVLVGLENPLRVDLDADLRGRGEVTHRGDDDAAVAGAEIVDDIAGTDAGHRQHLRDHFVRRGHVDDVQRT